MKHALPPRALIGVAAITALLLLVPLVAMQFSSEMSWTGGDFAAAAFLLFVAGVSLVVGTRLAKTRGRRVAVAAAVVLVFLTVWAELAVGLLR